MTEIPDRPFDKIAMDLVTDFTESNKGNKHILTIIDLLQDGQKQYQSRTSLPTQSPRHSSDTTYQDICAPVHIIRQWNGIQEPNF